MNENLVLQKLLNKEEQSHEELLTILSKVQQLAFFNQFIEKFLKGSHKDSLMNLCGQLRMEHLKGGEIVFVEGDKSNDKLYIIFSGKVALLRSKKFETFVDQGKPVQSVKVQMPIHRQSTNNSIQSSKQRPQFLKNVTQSKRFANKLINTLTQHQTRENELISSSIIFQLTEKYGETVRILQKGDGFGEVALIQNTPRGLTACSYSEDLFLLILKKLDFDTVKAQFVQSMKDKKLLIFSKFQVQNAYSTALLESLSYSFDVESYQHNQLLTFEGVPQKLFYLIQNGDILLEKLIDGQSMKLCLLTRGQFVGEEIVVNQTGICEFTAKVISHTATVMLINKLEFNQKFPHECKAQLKAEYLQKQKYRTNLQHSTFQIVQEVQRLPQGSPKQTIRIKINKKSLRSKDSQQFAEQDIKSIVEGKYSIYTQKYQEFSEKDLGIDLFGDDIRKQQKQRTLPSYDKTDDVLIKSFKQDLINKFRRRNKRNTFIFPLEQCIFLRSSTSDISAPLTAKTYHKQTASTGYLSP